MNPLAILFFLGCAGALLSVSRKWAPVPLLIGCTYMTLGQGIEIGSISLPIYRMLLLVGLVRMIAKGEAPAGGINLIDKLMFAWSAWVILASFFHDPERAGFVYSAGSVFNLASAYFLFRAWCLDLEELMGVIKILALLLVPIAAEMLMEKATGKNLFAVLGGVPENTLVRDGRLRAQGPFRHPILAGTVGATCFPLFLAIYRRHRLHACIGMTAGLVMTFASASSGPVMSLLAAAFALGIWRIRHLTGKVLMAFGAIYLLLMAVMEKPPYYLISRIDISGGSTGWHRAFLIEQTFKHLSEWWLFGTDYTRHWMPDQGFAMDPLHTDITNYYIGIGVLAGLPAMLLILAMFAVAFLWVGRARLVFEYVDSAKAFTVWCFGACLFAHSVTAVSVAYFDQSLMYIWLAAAVISSTHSVTSVDDSEINNSQPAMLTTETGGPAGEWSNTWKRLPDRWDGVSAFRSGVHSAAPPRNHGAPIVNQNRKQGV